MTSLHVALAGRPDGPPLVLAHGFTQTGRLWGEFGAILARTHRLVLIDLPGHGESDAVRADLPESGASLVDAAAGVLRGAGGDGAPFDLLGYSFGARVALHAVLARPDHIGRLVLIGATGGIEDAGARAARRARDDRLAEELESTGDLSGFLRRWTGAPMFAGLRPEAADLTERRRNTASGLASSLRLVGTGTQEPLWTQLGGVGAPALALAGADDPRFVVHARRLAATFPSAVPALVVGAGHAAHLHQPRLTARLVAGWLAATAGP